jgi:hypothetical protein
VEVKSTIRILSASSAGAWRGGVCGWTMVAACLLESCFTVVLPLAWWWATEHGLALAAPLDKGNVAQKGGRYPVTASPFTVESLSWREWPKRPPSMVWL